MVNVPRSSPYRRLVAHAHRTVARVARIAMRSVKRSSEVAVLRHARRLVVPEVIYVRRGLRQR